MTSLFLLSSCEQSELQQKSKTYPALPVSYRSAIEDCEDCPIDYCCCEIELLAPNSLSNVSFCGVFLGVSGTPCGPFSPGSPCSTFSGSYVSEPLLNTGDRFLFCAPIGGSFSIQNTSGHTIRIRFTCQYDVTNPDEQIIQLEDTEIAYFFNDGSCVLTECN